MVYSNSLLYRTIIWDKLVFVKILWHVTSALADKTFSKLNSVLSLGSQKASSLSLLLLQTRAEANCLPPLMSRTGDNLVTCLLSSAYLPPTPLRLLFILLLGHILYCKHNCTFIAVCSFQNHSQAFYFFVHCDWFRNMDTPVERQWPICPLNNIFGSKRSCKCSCAG